MSAEETPLTLDGKSRWRGGLYWRAFYFLSGFGPPPPESWHAGIGDVRIIIEREKRGEGRYRVRINRTGTEMYDTPDEAALAALAPAIRVAKKRITQATTTLRKLEQVQESHRSAGGAGVALKGRR